MVLTRLITLLMNEACPATPNSFLLIGVRGRRRAVEGGLAGRSFSAAILEDGIAIALATMSSRGRLLSHYHAVVTYGCVSYVSAAVRGYCLLSCALERAEDKEKHESTTNGWELSQSAKIRETCVVLAAGLGIGEGRSSLNPAYYSA